MDTMLNRAVSLMRAFESEFKKPIRLIGSLASYALIKDSPEVLVLWELQRKQISKEIEIKDFDFAVENRKLDREAIVHFFQKNNCYYEHNISIAKSTRLSFTDRENEKLMEIFLSPFIFAAEFDVSDHINVLENTLCPSDLLLLRLQTNLREAHPSAWDKAFADMVAFFFKYEIGYTLSTEIVCSRILSHCSRLFVLKHVVENIERFKASMFERFKTNHSVLNRVIPKVSALADEIELYISRLSRYRKLTYKYWISKRYTAYLSTVEVERDHADEMVFRRRKFGQDQESKHPVNVEQSQDNIIESSAN